MKSQGAYFEGDCGIIVLCTTFLVSCTFLETINDTTNISIFPITKLDTFWIDLIDSRNIVISFVEKVTGSFSSLLEISNMLDV